MATQTGTTLKTYFNTGDKPTEAQFVDLIDSNLNLTDGGNATGIISSSNHLTLQFTSGSTPGTNINIFSGSANEFDAIAPPFVENLQPHVHVVNIDFASSRQYFSGSFTTGETVSGSNIPSGRALWEVDYENDTKIVISGSEGGVDFPNGALHLSTGGSSAEQTALATANPIFRCAQGKPWWITTKFACDVFNQVEFFFGLSEVNFDTDSFHLESATAGRDRVGFVKAVHDNNAITAAVSKNADSNSVIAQALTSAQTYAANMDTLKLGIHWNGTTSIDFFIDKQTTGTVSGGMTKVHSFTTAAAFPDDSNMKLGLFLETGAAAVQTATIEYIRGAIVV